MRRTRPTARCRRSASSRMPRPHRPPRQLPPPAMRPRLRPRNSLLALAAACHQITFIVVESWLFKGLRDAAAARQLIGHHPDCFAGAEQRAVDIGPPRVVPMGVVDLGDRASRLDRRLLAQQVPRPPRAGRRALPRAGSRTRPGAGRACRRTCRPAPSVHRRGLRGRCVRGGCWPRSRAQCP